MLGIFLAALAATSWGIMPLFVRLGLQHLRTTRGTAISMMAGSTLVLFLAFAWHWEVIRHFPRGVVPWILLAGVVSPLGQLLHFQAVRMAGVARAMPILGTAPLFSASLAILLLGEHLTVPLGLGILAVVAGIALIVHSS
ncbi:MAG: DMT family transporter [Chloroflexi bacterium]|nr:DMT family transporter [Chloroflexota bacterium]